MSEEWFNPDSPSPPEPSPSSLPIDPPQVSMGMGDILSQLLAEVKSLRQENAEIKSNQSALESAIVKGTNSFSISQGNLGGEPDPNSHLGEDKFARHATLVTRPVVDNPQDYKYLVSASQLKRGD